MNGERTSVGERRLAGLAVVVTRPAEPGEPLTRALAAAGAEIRALPMVAFEQPSDPRPLARALSRWDDYDWVAFTSPRGVAAVSDAFAALGVDPRGRAPRRLAAVGPSTAAAAVAIGWRPDLVPERFDSEGLLEAMDRLGERLTGVRFLLPLADIARETLASGLRDRGAQVDSVVAYRSTTPTGVDAPSAMDLIGGALPVLLTFTSPSAARHLLERAGPSALEAPVAAIGPVTAAAASALGYRVVAVPEDHTLEGLAEAVCRWWESC